MLASVQAEIRTTGHKSWSSLAEIAYAENDKDILSALLALFEANPLETGW